MGKNIAVSEIQSYGIDKDSRLNENDGFDYRASVIVLVLEEGDSLKQCIESLINQTISKEEIEIILVESDSASDHSLICSFYENRFENIISIHGNEESIVSARNTAIKRARGKYLFHICSDSFLSEDTILLVTDFFERCNEEIDLVAYPYLHIRGEIKSKPHYRYTILTSSGIYNLRESRNANASINDLAICIRNKRNENILFSDALSVLDSEQQYCTDVLQRTMKLGFCDQGLYSRIQKPDGLWKTHQDMYYTSDGFLCYWNYRLSQSEESTSRYLQASFLGEINKRIHENRLFPYNLGSDSFNKIRTLLNYIDVDVINAHPMLDNFDKLFWLNLKDNADTKCYIAPGIISVMTGSRLCYWGSRIEVNLLRLQIRNGNMILMGFLKHPCFIIADKPILRAVVKEASGIEREEIPIHLSSWSYYRSKEQIAKFYSFEYVFKYSDAANLRFEVMIDDAVLETTLNFGLGAVFSNSKPVRHSFYIDNTKYWLKNNVIGMRKKCDSDAREANRQYNNRKYLKISWRAFEKWRLRTSVQHKQAKYNTRIWLYYDCHGVEKDNGYYQFIHDWDIHDGVERYYVVNDVRNSKSSLFTKEQYKHVIVFGSTKHKHLYLMAEKVLTAFVERENYIPFDTNTARHYQDLFHAEIIYLQHGVLHAHMPWKYSYDRLLIDKEVVSSQFEIDNLLNNYGFRENSLIASGMPRFDYIDLSKKPQKRILFAPSWRSYLVTHKRGGEWSPADASFECSLFYKEIKAFLSNPILQEVLTHHDYILDLKLHPIMAKFYGDKFECSNTRVRMANASVDESDYSVFITDYSSYRFDFVYLKRAIMYFFPDEDLFRLGMCAYRETDLPIEGMFGPLAHSAEEAILYLEEILSRGGVPDQVFEDQMDGFFLHYDNRQRDRIYSAIVASDNT